MNNALGSAKRKTRDHDIHARHQESALKTVLLVEFCQRCKRSCVILVRDLAGHLLSLIETAVRAQCLPAFVQPVNYIEVIWNGGIPLNEIPDVPVPKIRVAYIIPDKAG